MSDMVEHDWHEELAELRASETDQREAQEAFEADEMLYGPSPRSSSSYKTREEEETWDEMVEKALADIDFDDEVSPFYDSNRR